MNATQGSKVHLDPLNRQAACPPRAAVSVNQGGRLGFFTHDRKFAFDDDGDHSGYVGDEITR